MYEYLCYRVAHGVYDWADVDLGILLMRMMDEVAKLIFMRRMGIPTDVPAHLQEEFNERWTTGEKLREENYRKNKLIQNPFSVERYKIATLQREPMEYVAYSDYEMVVKYLQEQLDRAYSEARSNRYDSSTSWRD